WRRGAEESLFGREFCVVSAENGSGPQFFACYSRLTVPLTMSSALAVFRCISVGIGSLVSLSFLLTAVFWTTSIFVPSLCLCPSRFCPTSKTLSKLFIVGRAFFGGTKWKCGLFS